MASDFTFFMHDVRLLIQQHGDLFYLLTFLWTAMEGETFVIFAGLALISHLSTPDPPVFRNPDAELLDLLSKVPSDTCRREIAVFHQDYRHDNNAESESVDVTNFVGRICHASLDSREFPDALWRQHLQLRDYPCQDKSHSQPHPQPAHLSGLTNRPMHWISYNMTSTTARLPSLAYLIMVGPEDSVSAVSRLIDHIYAFDHIILIHVDKKCEPNMHLGISSSVGGRQNIKILEPERVTWGSFSVVRTQV